jgi:hypothetical protein
MLLSPLAPVDICKLSRDAGTCVDFKLLWHYDLESKSCKRFWYGGCGGNENRFHSQEECEKMCSPGKWPLPLLGFIFLLCIKRRDQG